MKTLLLITLMLSSILGFTQNQALINGTETFGIWDSTSVGELPRYWDGFNKQIIVNGMHVGDVECIKKDSADPQDADYSVRLVSTSVLGGAAVPGMLTTGTLDIDFNSQNGDITGGMPYAQKPTQLKGWYKYNPVGNDTAKISVWFKQAGSEIGGGDLKIFGQTNLWTEFTVDLYYQPGSMPDTANILFLSSNAYNGVPIGSALEIDHIWFQGGGVGTENATKRMDDIKVYPNPTNGMVNVACTGNPEEININLYSVSGQLVMQTKMQGPSNRLNFGSLSPGTYYMEIIRDGYRKVQSLVIN